MTDRMKESVFSAIGDFDGVSVLDLYAGSGSLGLEALSRGAAQAIFVENSREAIIKLNENIEATDLADRAKVEWAEVGPILKRGAIDRVDLIFLDPPYSTPPDSVLADLEALVMGGFLSDQGRIVLHRPTKERKLKPLGLKLLWEREYGQSAIYIWAHEDEEESG